MGGKVQARRVFDPPSSQLSYVVRITLPQPTIRLRIPKLVVKVIQKRNQTRSENDENGSKTRKKTPGGKSFRKKVGSMFSNVFGKKKSPATNSEGENGELDSNVVDEEMKNLRKMVERLDMQSEKIIGKSTFEKFILHDGVQEMAAAVANSEGKERPVVIKEMAKSGDERKERPKSRRTFLRRTDLELMNTGKINNVDDSSTVVTNANVDMGAILSLKQAEILNDNLPRLRPRTQGSARRPKMAWSMKKMNSVLVGRSEKHELCKKRILMGVKCRPLNQSGIIHYDENGVLLPDIIH